MSSGAAAAGTSGNSSYDLPPGAESVITQVRHEEEKKNGTR